MGLTLANTINDMRIVVNDVVDNVAAISLDTIDNLGDVDISGVADQHILQYNTSTQNFESVEFPTTVAGSDTQIQFNDGGELAGDANLTFDISTSELSVPSVNTTSFTTSTAEITTGNVDSLTANTVEVTTGNVDSLTANTLEVTTGNVDSLTANTLEVTTGNVDSLTANTLEVTTGNVDSLTANSVEITSGNVDSLTANSVEITSGNVDSLTANTINASGVVCASSFEGDGSNLTGVVKETSLQNQIEIDYALIAGGGGGGVCGNCLCNGGGGGAGGIITHFGHNISANTEYCVIIGAGGAACFAGEDSHFGDFAIARGGGEGTRNGREDSTFKRGGMGGSGGGGTAGAGSNCGCDNGGLVAVDTVAPVGATIHGSKGASGNGTTSIRAGGGGGAYCSPCNADLFGGTGIKINLDGRGFYYGGGGSSEPSCNGFGGLGGGADCNCCPPQDLNGCIISTLRGKTRSGAAHTGGGAASRSDNMGCYQCYLGAGGSGLLMIRYANTVTANLQSGATTFNSCGEELLGNKKVLRIITSGTITFTC